MGPPPPPPPPPLTCSSPWLDLSPCLPSSPCPSCLPLTRVFLFHPSSLNLWISSISYDVSRRKSSETWTSIYLVFSTCPLFLAPYPFLSFSLVLVSLTIINL